VVGAIAIGCAYALIAIGYSLVYRTSRAINFAQGDMAILGAYIAFAGTFLRDHAVLGIVLSIVVVAGLSIAVEALAFRPLYKYGTVFIVASSIALVFVLEDFMQLVWGADTVSVAPLIDGTVVFAGLRITGQQLLIVGVTIVFLVVLQLLFRSTAGVAMRASAENGDVSRLLGINPRAMIRLSYAVAGAASAIGGVLVAPLTQLRPGTGATIGLTAVIAAIVGGLGSIPGAVLGGLLIGFVEIWTAYLAGGDYAKMFTLGILILVLLIRPTGLLGEEGTSFRR
jgi:branched-chain amino acid transport system permease protein